MNYRMAAWGLFLLAASVRAVGFSFVQIDGSSTVYPISEAVVEEYEKSIPHRVKIAIGSSGTGAGLDRLCRGWIDIADASRPISIQEKVLCLHHHIHFVEIPIAVDAIVVITNKENPVTRFMTIPILRKIWSPKNQSSMQLWSDVDAHWPKRELHLYAPAPGSGTLTTFTKDLFNIPDYIRSDYIGTQDLNVVVMGVSHDRSALGFVSYAYYKMHQSELLGLPIENPQTHDVIAPTEMNVSAGRYPFSRRLFVYVNKDHMEKSAVLRSFLNYYVEEAARFAVESGYIAMSPYDYFKARRLIKSLEESQ